MESPTIDLIRTKQRKISQFKTLVFKNKTASLENTNASMSISQNPEKININPIYILKEIFKNSNYKIIPKPAQSQPHTKKNLLFKQNYSTLHRFSLHLYKVIKVLLPPGKSKASIHHQFTISRVRKEPNTRPRAEALCGRAPCSQNTI